MIVDPKEIESRIKNCDYLFFFKREQGSFTAHNEILIIYAVQNKFAIYTGRNEYVLLMSEWQYEKFAKKITKYTKDWKVHDIKNWAGDNWDIVINFDGAPRAYCGNQLCKNWKKFYKLVDCIRHGATIL